jgi:hypothetical protein
MLATAILSPAASQAKWKPQYASNSPEIRDWYKSRKLTDAAAKRFAFSSCCDGSDKVETQFRVDKTTGGDKWYYQQDGRWVEVPPDVIWWDEHSPTGEAVLFAAGGKPTCFFPPRGGCDGFAAGFNRCGHFVAMNGNVQLHSMTSSGSSTEAVPVHRTVILAGFGERPLCAAKRPLLACGRSHASRA